MSDVTERVAKALREGDEVELKRIKEAVRKDRLPPDGKVILDCRELCWFKDHRNWVMPEGENIDEWLPWARVEDDRLEGTGSRAAKCSDPTCFCHWDEALK
jgi:hypothetical protein